MSSSTLRRSLDLEQTSWSIVGESSSQDYVFIAIQKNGGDAIVDLHELIPDATGAVSFSVGITVDKSLVSFPKLNLLIPLILRRDNRAFSLTVGKGEFETTLSETPTEAELENTSGAIKRAAIRELDTYFPAE